mmetsp:Transcript_126178/g.299611  ORF Transcript_126178/g.299611 Transcript_126178/m.299611 type:complete len:230 (+) Transcript_126178:47-736(+)
MAEFKLSHQMSEVARKMSDSESVSTADLGSSSSCSMDDDRFQVKLVFAQAKRGIRSLNRGYRTPDPSPSPLPKCMAPQEILVDRLNDVELVGPCPISSFSPSYEGRSDEGTRSRRLSREEPWNERIRTPSPVMESPYRTGSLGFFNPPGQYSAMPSLTHAFSCPVSMDCASLQETGTTDMGDAESPSLGSIGHPYSCKQACKYSGKSKGCKDGRNCIRCHICFWTRKTR